jgi:acetyl esterase/lipase
MIAPLAKLIDWYGLQTWWGVRLKSANQWIANSKLEEALQFLKGQDFIPTASAAARVEFDDVKHFRFPSPRPGDFVANNTVYGRLYRCAGHWEERPVIVLLHGGGGDPDYRLRFPFIARHCNRAGFNAVTLVAPYHFQRRGPGLADWNHLQTAEAFAQGVAEIRAMTGWLLEQGCPTVALWGNSLGGWFAGLAAWRDRRLASVVLTVPGVRMDYKFSRGDNVFWKRVREALQVQKPAHEALDATPLNLTLLKPIVPKQNILLIEGRYDSFIEPEITEDLWQKWERPEIWRLPHGHVSWMFTPGVTARVLGWLSPRMNKQFSACPLSDISATT